MADQSFEAQFTIQANQAITQLGRMRQAAEEAGPSYQRLATSIGRMEQGLVRATGAEQSNARATNAATAATRSAARAEEQRIANLSRTRYALYDVSNAAAIVGAGLTASFLLPTDAAIRFEKAFAQVERTTGVTGAAAQQLKADFIELSQAIPVSFEELSKIGAIAGQLGIASNDVDDFASVIARFSATTDLSIDAAATSIGRLTQLLPDATGEYEKVASAILEVGVNSVASESQITAIATQLSGVAASAQLTTPDLVALSGALASVGTAPELSRGLVTRLFTNIQVAIGRGGTALEDFGRLSGKTGSQFASDWGSNKGEAILDLLQGINRQGDNAAQALNAVGIASVRDVPALQRLAANTQIYTRALSDANSQFDQGTALSEQYGIISSTTSARIQVLGQSFQALLASIGESTLGFTSLIDGVSGALKVITDFVSTPFGSTLAAVALAVSALGAGLAIAVAIATRARATYLALVTATASVGTSSAGAAVSVGGLTAALTGSAAAGTRAQAAMTGAATAVKGLSLAALLFLGYDLAGGLANSAREALGLKTSLAGVGATIDTMNLEKINQDLGLTKTGIDAVYGSLAGRASNGGAALGQDFNANTGDLFGFANILDTIKDYDTQLANLVGSGNGEKAAELFSYISSKAVEQGATLKEVQAQFPEYFTSLESGANSGAVAIDEFSSSTETLAAQLQSLIDPIFEGINAEYALQAATEALGESFVNEGANVAFSGSAIQDTISAILQSAGSAPQAAGMLQGLFDSIVQGGYASASQLSYLQASIASLTGGKAVKAIPFNFSPFVSGATKAQKALDKAGGSAKNTAKEVRTLVNYGSDLGKVFDRSFDLRFGDQQAFDKITEKFNSIAEANQDAIEAMEDYRQEIEETQASIAGLTADKRIQEYFLKVANAYGDTLRAGKIAANLAEINAELADNQTDLTRTNKKLQDAQNKQTKSTIGNSQAAIDNRAELLGLVGSYQDYVKQLATSGLSQDELKARVQQLQQDFIRQATQLGYNTTEVLGYAAGFTDLATAINGVPRDITVTANVDPARQALQEFLDEAASKSANVGIGSTGAGGAGENAALEFKGAFERQMARTPIAIEGFLIEGQQVYRVPGTGLKLYNQGGFVPGATPGNPRVDNVLGKVAGGGYVGLQGGEPIINNKARGFYGDAMFNAINSLQFPKQGFATGGFVPSAVPRTARTSSASSGPTVVVLDAAQFQALINSGNVNVSIGNKAVAGAVAGVNQQYADLGVGN